jgi:hypothetical protein
LFLFSLGLLSQIFTSCYSYGGTRESISKEIKRKASFLVFFFTTFYLISMTIVQTQGLDTTGLKGICDLNPVLLNSSTGYLKE